MSAIFKNIDLSSDSGEQIKSSISGNYLTQSFQDQHQIKDFIRSTNLINIVETVCEGFVKNLRTSNECPEARLNAIIIKLPLIYSDILHYSLDLLHFVIDEPLQFLSSVKYSVFGIVREICKELTKTNEAVGVIADIDIDQVHILVRFVGLPLQTDLCYQPHIHSLRTGLSEVIGILSAVSEPNKVV